MPGRRRRHGSAHAREGAWRDRRSSRAGLPRRARIDHLGFGFREGERGSWTMRDVVITGAARTAIGSYGKSLAQTPPTELGAQVGRAGPQRPGGGGGRGG